MNHVSDFRGGALCGKPQDLLKADGDRMMAATNEYAQSLVDCVECRSSLGVDRADR